jgi:hypothetical protein
MIIQQAKISQLTPFPSPGVEKQPKRVEAAAEALQKSKRYPAQRHGFLLHPETLSQCVVMPADG